MNIMGKVLHVVFLLGFITILVSCLIPVSIPNPNTSVLADVDGNGLIEIPTLEALHNMRYDLAGRTYKTSAEEAGNSLGCPATGCFGYELSQNLDFDTTGETSEDSSTWTGDNSTGFTLDPDDDNDIYFDVAPDGTGGWLPIGTHEDPFTATFDGKGYTISNLAIKRDWGYIAFFGHIAGNAVIRNIGLVDNLADYDGNSRFPTYTGGLVGRQSAGSIIASFTRGNAYGGAGAIDAVGALVGRQNGGDITASYATGTADGGNGERDAAGALTGLQVGGNIVASYATGIADGGAGDNDKAGRLSYMVNIGRMPTNTNSYGFGTTRNAEQIDTTAVPPMDVSAANLLATALSAGLVWNDADKDTAGAWDFGDTTETPVLRYADYDGPSGSDYSCETFPVDSDGNNLCENNAIIPGQER